jgi:hypothetical protein
VARQEDGWLRRKMAGYAGRWLATQEGGRLGTKVMARQEDGRLGRKIGGYAGRWASRHEGDG